MSIAPGSIVTDGLASSTVVPTPTMTTSVTTSAVSSSLEALYMPITTSWETPLSCTWTFDISQTPEPGTPGPIAFLDMEPVPGASSLSCYPDGMFYGNQTGTFSPATCPNGWTTVSLRQDENAVETMATTTAVCCSSYVYGPLDPPTRRRQQQD